MVAWRGSPSREGRRERRIRIRADGGAIGVAQHCTEFGAAAHAERGRDSRRVGQLLGEALHRRDAA